MRHHDAGNVRSLIEYCIDLPCEYQPLVGCYKRAGYIGKLLGFNLRISLEFRYLGYDLSDRLSDFISAESPRFDLLPCNRATSRNHHNARQIRLRLSVGLGSRQYTKK